MVMSMSTSRRATVRRFVAWSGNKFSIVGLVWGSLELSIILVGALFGYLLGRVDQGLYINSGATASRNQFLVFLVFIISILSGYSLRDLEKSVKALLVSQFTAFFTLLWVWYLSPSIFPSVYAPLYAMGLAVDFFILGLFGCLVGSASGAYLFRLSRTYRYSLNNYRLVLIAILFFVLAVFLYVLAETWFAA
jgi:hypothetical protein